MASHFMLKLLLLALGLNNASAVYTATSTDPEQIGSMFCQRSYPTSNTMDIFYPALTIDTSGKDQLNNSPPECNCRVGIVNRYYQFADSSILTPAKLGDLSTSNNNGRITSIKTQWDSTSGALIGVSVGTPKPAYRVVGTINTGAIT